MPHGIKDTAPFGDFLISVGALAWKGQVVPGCLADDGGLLDEIATPEPDGKKLLLDAAERLHLSARGYHRVLRVARTLADLDGSPTVRRIHVAEALSYRRIALSG